MGQHVVVAPDADDLLARLSARITRDLLQRMTAGLDVQAALDQRDAPTFEEAWVDCDMRLSAVGATPPTAIQEATIMAIRSAAYLRAFDASQSADLAGYVSDDFELIANSIAAGNDDPFVAYLLDEYLAGRFPVTPPATTSPGVAHLLGGE